jgi:hypothetical protein
MTMNARIPRNLFPLLVRGLWPHFDAAVMASRSFFKRLSDPLLRGYDLDRFRAPPSEVMRLSSG